MLKHPSSYCSELERVENYELALKDNFKGWDCHHRLETHTSDGERRLVDISCKELKALGMYYNRPPEELIFLTVFDHVSLHHRGKPGTWIGRHHSEETKKKISEAQKGNTATKGMHWFNNGKVNKMCFECPDGFVPGMLR